jgi:TolB-like protein
MIYAFDEFELDASKVELRRDGAPVAIEPQVFALLLLLVENQDRMVSKDEIIEKIWDGRIVSESALTSRIKSARKALGDDGKTQSFIRTVHSQGFRFVAEAKPVRLVAYVSDGLGKETDTASFEVPTAGKPSIAVLPFRLVGVAGPHAAIADALPHELISVLSRLRWLFVIARGSSFRFRSAEPDISQVGRALGVRYCLSGVIEITGEKIAVTVELTDTRDCGVLWGERFSAAVDDIHNIREQIISSVVSAMEIQIPMNEAQAARLKSPEQLDAWSAYHVGLQHLHRFNNKDNGAATAMFERAIALESDFARAHAGLSSTHFQSAFLQYNSDLTADRKLARKHAERSIELDPLDPFANFAMGRTHWVENNISGSAGWLERATVLSPNYAQGVYARAWADVISGRGGKDTENIDLALMLSPLDPFRYAMLGVRAFNHLVREEDSEAAHWADESARSPGAHVLIAAIAVAAHGINGNMQKASHWAENVRSRKPDMTRGDFFQAFPFENEATRQRIAKALSEFGF